MKTFALGCLSLVGVLVLIIVAVAVVGAKAGWWDDDINRAMQKNATERAVASRTPGPSPTPRLFSDTFPTATAMDVTSFVDFGGTECEGYNDWIAEANTRSQRFAVVQDQLRQAVEGDDIDSLNTENLITEMGDLIGEERTSDPPEQLIPYSEQRLEYFRLVKTLLQSIEDRDDEQFDETLDEILVVEEAGEIDAKAACGI